MDVIARIDQARRSHNVLEHPFYQRWSAGELSALELDLYARQYRHAVVALADASHAAAREADAEHAPGLERHAEEETAHVALWDRFAEAAGRAARAPEAETAGRVARASEDGAALDRPLAETERCAAAWRAGEDALEHLAVLYAIEASQPAISQTKLEGLVGRYGHSEEGPATEYFRLHATLDAEHARQARELIGRLMSADPAQAQAQADRMVARAQDALRGNWALLDGVDGQFAHAA
jgi:pyrroloquinoline-quinone synthase